MDRILGYTRSNQRGWDEIAPARPAQPAAFFLDGGTTLDDFEPGLQRDIAGKRMLHLDCANGNGSISWTFRGASVTPLRPARVCRRRVG